MYQIIALILASLVFASPLSAQEEIRSEALRSALTICSQGKVESSSASGGLEGFIGLLKRNVEAGAGGEMTSSEVGAILEKTYSEDVRFEAYKIYHECLINFILPLATGENSSGPGIQSTEDFQAIARRASTVGKLLVIEFTLSGKSRKNPYGWWSIDLASYRGLSTAGGIYRLADAGGLQEKFKLNRGDTYNLIFTFELLAGELPNRSEPESFSFSGTIAYHLNNNSRSGMQLGLRDIPLNS